MMMNVKPYEEITDIMEHLQKNNPSYCLDIPIHSIDDIVCRAYIDLATGGKIRRLDGTYAPAPDTVRLKIITRFRSIEIYSKYFEAETTHQDIVEFLKTIPDMKFCYMTDQLYYEKPDHPSYYEKKFMHDIFASIESDNCRMTFGDCPVCLESTYTKLPCGHHLCLRCESKMKECKCPQCREKYRRCLCVGDCDSEDEEVY